MFRKLVTCTIGLRKEAVHIARRSVASQTVDIKVDSQLKEDESNAYKQLRKVLPSSRVFRVKKMVENRLYHPAATTLADLVQSSPDLQRLVALGVSFTDVEKHEGAADLLAELVYYPHIHEIVTLLQDLGIEDIGALINKCPFILGEPAETIKERLLYLSSKNFQREQINAIVNRCPKWLLEDVSEVDARLGAIQQLFELQGDELRAVTCRSPRVILSNIIKLKEFAFTMKEVYSLTNKQVTELVVNCPSVMTTSNDRLKKRLDFLLNTMNIPMKQIIEWPMVLRSRERIVEERHYLLNELGLAEYNCEKPGYISLKRLVSGRDEVFCVQVAQIPLHKYYDYVKTL